MQRQQQVHRDAVHFFLSFECLFESRGLHSAIQFNARCTLLYSQHENMLF